MTLETFETMTGQKAGRLRCRWCGEPFPWVKPLLALPGKELCRGLLAIIELLDLSVLPGVCDECREGDH
jgi:hypothetical protein